MSYSRMEVEVLTEAHKVVPAIAAVEDKNDRRLLVHDLQEYAVGRGLLPCQVYPIMFAAAMHWLQQATKEAGRLRGVDGDQVLREMSMAAAVRQANAA